MKFNMQDSDKTEVSLIFQQNEGADSYTFILSFLSSTKTASYFAYLTQMLPMAVRQRAYGGNGIEEITVSTQTLETSLIMQITAGEKTMNALIEILAANGYAPEKLEWKKYLSIQVGQCSQLTLWEKPSSPAAEIPRRLTEPSAL